MTPVTATHPRREGLDLLDGEWYASEPHEDWAWLRDEAPAYFDEASNVWGISRYEDVLAMEKDPVRFSNKNGPRPHLFSMPSMISMDDPQHKARRSLVNRGFTPRRIADLDAFVTRLCRRIVDDVCERGTCDFVWDVAAPLPLLVIAHLLGFDDDVHDDLLRWSDDMLRATTPSASQEQQELALHASLAFWELQLEVIADRRARPRDDLISTLCHAEIDGQRLDDESIVQETLLLLIGGDETSRHVLTGGMLALLDHPDQTADLATNLATNLDQLPVAVEEILRWISPVKNMARTVTEDVELHGQHLRPDDQLILLYPSANRDERAFDAPDRLDLQRHPNPHLAFGFGSHYCLGASLARLELRSMFQEVLTRLPDLELAVDPGDLPRRPSNFITGLESMPVRFTPTGPVA